MMKNFNKQQAIGVLAFIGLIFLFCFIKYSTNNANQQALDKNNIANNETTLSEISDDVAETYEYSKDTTSSLDDSSNISSDNSENASESSTEPETTKEPKINYKKLIDFDAEFPYIIKINRTQNWAVVYGLDKDGEYSIPYKIFVCSTGRDEGDTPIGTFKMSDKYDWRLMVDGTYAQYAIRIHGPIMLHSVPYYTRHKNNLEVEEYNKLGSSTSLGCIRFNVKNIKWIYDNCPVGTEVVIYDSESETPPLELPKLRKAKSSGKKAGWDPTDPDENNPWKKKSSEETTSK